MHPTANQQTVYNEGPARRVMPSVMLLSGVVMKQIFVLMFFLFFSCSAPVTQKKLESQFQVVVPEAVNDFFIEINERAKIANLSNLRAKPLPKDDLEVRVWSGFGIVALQGFVLKRSSGDWSAVRLESVFRNIPPSKHQMKMDAPRSGE